MKKKRESLDARLAKLNYEERMLALIHGDFNATNPARRLAAQARALSGLRKVLSATTEPNISEGYKACHEELKRCAGELCAQALLDKDFAFFSQLAKEIRKVDTGKRASTAHRVRLILLFEGKAEPVNLSRLAPAFKEFQGIAVDASSLGRIARRLEVPTLTRGRPAKSDS